MHIERIMSKRMLPYVMAALMTTSIATTGLKASQYDRYEKTEPKTENVTFDEDEKEERPSQLNNIKLLTIFLGLLYFSHLIEKWEKSKENNNKS